MTEQQACTLCGAGGHTAAQCHWREQETFEEAVAKRQGKSIAWVASYRDESTLGYMAASLQHAWWAWQARAALAQPSPKCATCHDQEVVSTTDVDHNGDHIEIRCPDCAQPSPAPELKTHTFPPVPTEAMLKAYREVSPGWLCIDGWRAMMEVATVAKAGQVPEGYRLIRIEHFDAIKAQLNPKQVDAYRGRNIFDEDKVYANWEACRSALDEIKDVFQLVDWDAENDLPELLAAAPAQGGE